MQLLARPLGRLSEAVDRAELMRLSWPFTLVAPRACAKSARLTARCGGVWRAMAMSLPGHTAFRHALGRAIRCEFGDFFGTTPQELIDDGIYRFWRAY